MNLDAAALEVLLQLPGRLGICSRNDLIHQLEQSDFASEICQQAGELAPDGARSDDRYALGPGFHREHNLQR